MRGNTSLAAIVYADKSINVDAILGEFVSNQQCAGWLLGGLLQSQRVGPGGKNTRHFVDIRTAQEFSMLQNLGSNSESCSLDPNGMAQASQVLRRALADRVDLAVVNRFGELESTGGGFTAEILALADASIPVLTVVAQRHLAAWRRFTGDFGVELTPQPESLNAWCNPWLTHGSNFLGEPRT